MENNTGKLKLIVNDGGGQEVQLEDRGGGETHGFTDLFKRKIKEVEISADKFKDNLEEAMSSIDNVLASMTQTLSDKWQLDSVSVGLTVSAEGSIGIATAGVETSIEVSFTPKSEASE